MRNILIFSQIFFLNKEDYLMKICPEENGKPFLQLYLR